jgi:hypothetical protein
MSRHAKEKSNLKKFLTSPFMDLMMMLSLGALFGYVFVEAFLGS